MQITVACPECGYFLHLPNRDLLGRKGKCPQCAHKFIMEESHAVPPPPAQETAEKPLPEPETKPETKQPETPSPPASKKPPASPPVSEKPKQPEKKPPVAPPAKKPAKPSAPPPPTPPVEEADDSEPLPADFFKDIEAPEPVKTPAAAKRPAASVSGEFAGVLRCLNCHAAIPFQEEEQLRDIGCSHCNRSFPLVPPETPPAAMAMPAKVGGYSLSSEARIGVGPFGSVYQAKDRQNGDPVAVKVSWGGQVAESEREAFLAALRSAMQLRHANIVTLREVDGQDDRVYLVSDHVKGIDLAEYLEESTPRNLSFREIASLCAQIAGGVHHAHRFDVVHGNLKPTNIRIDADLQPHIMDFGLNKRQQAVTLTEAGRLVGQAAYLAPEQLPGTRRDADQVTDVYAVGVILYELLARRKPFGGQGQDLLDQIAQGNPPGPRSFNSSVPKPLETICLKCLEVHPRDRYPSAMDVVKELRRYLEGQPIHTKSPGVLARLGRWARRRPNLL